MAPMRKSRIKKKQFAKLNEVSSDKDGLHARKCKMEKNRSSDKSGSQWSNEELKHFYEAFRKYGKDWKKVASAIRGRSVNMVKALYSMNRAYLSLPEGTASVAGLIAMMTDHYNMLEGSNSEGESSDGPGISCKQQKHAQRKFQPNKSNGLRSPFPDLFDSVRSYGCLSLFKKKRSGGSRPRIVGKRTPRFPVSFLYDKDERSKSISSNKENPKLNADSADEEVAHVAALALAEASQRGGSPQASQAPSRRTDNMSANECAESEMPRLNAVGSRTDESWYKGRPEYRAAECEALMDDATYVVDAEGTSDVEIQQKQNEFQEKKSKLYGVENSHLSDIRETFSGTEEGLVPRVVKDEPEQEVTCDKGLKSSPLGPRKRGRQMFSGDENSALHALQTLAELSLNILVPDTAIDSESSVQDKKEKRKPEKPCGPEAVPSKCQRERPKISRKNGRKSADVDIIALEKQEKDSSLHIDALSKGKKEAYQPTTNTQKKKRKSLAATGSSEAGKWSTDNTKCVNNTVPLPKEEKPLQSPDLMNNTNTGSLDKYSIDSTGQISPQNQAVLPTKPRSRRKENLKKMMVKKEMKSTQNVGNNALDGLVLKIHNRPLNLQNTLSHCLSSQALRRWCAFEWFYSAIDYPWFARSEFVEYLNHVGLGHVPRLTRVEWGVIRSSLGKPRRLSKQFLEEERKKLEQYRELVRTHYGEVRAGIREGLATDLAHPLSVGQLVIACHPRTREIHDGNVLIVDHKKYMIQFDKPELGVEFVEDIDCMPLNPLESLSEALRKLHGASNKSCKKFIDPTPESMEFKSEVRHKFLQTECLENPEGLSDGALSIHPMNASQKHAMGDTLDTMLQAKAAAEDVITAQAQCKQPVTLAEIQEKEADIRAISGLAWALDKKAALLSELKHMNEEVLGNRKHGNYVIDPEFKKQYAAVVVQLKEANDQVGFALLSLKECNAFYGNSMPRLRRSLPNAQHMQVANLELSTCLAQDSGPQVVGIAESSRQKAKEMVDIAMQVMASLKEGEDAFLRVGKALDSICNDHSTLKYIIPDPRQGSLPCQDQTAACTPRTTGLKENNVSNGDGEQFSSELISSCVASLLMIQTFTESQYPPAEVAQLLNDAVASLHPRCLQNLSIYREIQQCMGMVKHQILALIPT